MATAGRLLFKSITTTTSLLQTPFVTASIIVRNAHATPYQDTEQVYNTINNTLDKISGFTNFASKQERLNELANELQHELVMEDENKMIQLNQQYYHLSKQLSDWKEIEENTKEYWQFYELATEDDDESLQKDCLKQLQKLSIDVDELYHSLLLNNEDDKYGCYVHISSGSGGWEAQDWAETLFSMYIAWCKRHEYDHKILHKKKADVGINQGVLEINAYNAYGWLKYEEGVHRRSRVSPYGQSAGTKRQTSFASVAITPMDNINGNDVNDDIPEKDLDCEFFRGSGPGGQHRNTTDSAIRLTHKPTGITVTVQDERNQYGAKIAAIRYLKFKLLKLEEENLKKVKKNKYDSCNDSTFSNQIRNYVYTPYQMIKDNRTKCEVKNHAMKDALENGNIDLLLRKSLEQFNSNQYDNI